MKLWRREKLKAMEMVDCSLNGDGDYNILYKENLGEGSMYCGNRGEREKERGMSSDG